MLVSVIDITSQTATATADAADLVTAVWGNGEAGGAVFSDYLHRRRADAAVTDRIGGHIKIGNKSKA